MKINQVLTVGALLVGMSTPVALSAMQPGHLSDEQKSQMEQVIHDYLIKNPEVLMEASEVLRHKQEITLQEQAKSAIAKNANLLFSDSLTTSGNPKGNVTLVEFFDYQCIHCKKMHPVVSELLQKDNNLKVVYKEFPIFGKSSTIASKAALAAAMQGKYQQMQEALLKVNEQLSKQRILDTAKSIGLDVAKLETDMKSKAIADAIAANRQLAESMHLMGTPAFVVAHTPQGEFNASATPTFIPGATTVAALQDLISKASSSK